MKLPLWSSLGVFRGSRNAPLKGDATTKRCSGDGKALMNDGPGTVPTGQRDATGERQRLPCHDGVV